MHQKAVDFLMPVGPTASATPANGSIFNIALSAASSTATDLSGANFVGLYNALQNGCYVTLTASVDIWYRWDVATGTVDETKTAASTPANQGILLPAGIRVPEMVPRGCFWIIAKATPNAGTLCIQISSQSAPSFLGPGLGISNTRS
jgi:hypothetical protein